MTLSHQYERNVPIRDLDGQLGSSGCSKQDRPQQVTEGGIADRHITQVSCGGHHTLALTQGGEVYFWGKMLETRLPTPTLLTLAANKSSSAAVITHIAAGWAHSACVDSEGQVHVSTLTISRPQLNLES